MSQQFLGLHPKPRFRNSQCSSKPVAVITLLVYHSPTFKIISSLVHIFIVGYTSISVKTWGEEPLGNSIEYPQNLEMNCFHFITENSTPSRPNTNNSRPNYEKEISFVQSAYILT